MLRLVLGLAGSGKTHYILQEMHRRAERQAPSIFLVPEQFSSSAEGLVYTRLGEQNSAWVETLSFRTLAERALKTGGGIGLPVLSDAARAVFMRRALAMLGDNVRHFARHRHSAVFCALCADTISELKTAGATGKMLRQAAAMGGDEKMAEIALLMEAYDAQLANAAIDPEGRLTLAAESLGEELLAGKACYIDDFDGFTAPEYALVEKLLLHCEEVTAALCCDKLEETEDNLGRFSPVRRTAAHLKRLAQQGGTAVAAPRLLGEIHRGSQSGLHTLNRLLAGGKADGPAPRMLALTPCGDEWEEMLLVAGKMHALAKSGVPYSRMAVVCRDVSLYAPAARRAFAVYDIPYFYDNPDTAEYTPPVAFLRGALRLLQQGLTSGPILDMVKTGLTGASPQAAAALENYVYTWGPKAAEWRQPFCQNPAGLMSKMDKRAENALADAEGLRAALVPPLEDFLRRSRQKNVREVSRQLYLLLEYFGAGEQTEKESLPPAEAEAAREAWDMAMTLLDEMVSLMGGETLPPEDYADLFLLLVRATEVGKAPQVLESAVFTGADRMRLAGADYCFVVGVLEGEFPMQVGYSGLLTHADRDLLVQQGAEMPGSFENRTLLEEMFFYRALTSAEKGLFISWPTRRGGETRYVSAALKPLTEAFTPPPLTLNFAEKAATPQAAFMRLAESWHENPPEAATLRRALEMAAGEEGAAAASQLALLAAMQPTGEFAMWDKGLLRRMVGEEMMLSPTRAQSYFECPFSYFLERVLRVQPRRKAEISPLESGNFVHYLLEQVLKEAGEDFAALPDDALAALAEKYAALFIEENIPLAALRDREALRRVQQTTLRLLSFLRDDAAQSAFAVDALELDIGGEDSAVPAFVVETPAGNRLRVIGKVDRVDTLRQSGKTYLRIVDYKTGAKKFDLADVYCGLNMQMLVYMAALQQAGGRYPNAAPAGVLYLLSDPAPPMINRGEKQKPPFSYDGLVLNEEEVLRALDKDAGGVFVPLTYLKSGAPRKTASLASLEKLGRMESHIEAMLAQMADGVYSGEFNARPLISKKNSPCGYCHYRSVCRHVDGQNETAVTAPAKVFEAEEVPLP